MSESKKGTSKSAGKAKTGAKTGAKRVAQPVYSQEKMLAARAAGNYVKLGDKKGNLSLSGAVNKWKTSPNFVYVPSLRVAGEPADIERILVELGNAGSDVRQHIAAGYRAGSQETEAFKTELAELKAGKAKVASKAKKATQLAHTIAFYAEQIDNAVVETKAGGVVERKSRSPKAGAKKAAAKSRSKSASPKAKKAGAKKAGAKKAGTKSKSRSKSASPKAKRASPKGKRAAKPLAEKLEALAEGKVMDVSNLHVDGSGAKVVAEPGAKSKKVRVPGTRLVSSLKNGVKAAAKLLGDDALVERWMAAKAGGSREASPAAASGSPARTLPLSPLRPLSPSGGLPPLPTVRSGSPRSGSGVSLPKVPLMLGSPRS